MEAPPKGTVDIFTAVHGSKEAQLKWLAPNKPNGKLTYTVFVTGLFYADQGTFFSLHNKSNDSTDIPFHVLKNSFSTKFFSFFATPLIILA